MDLWILLLLAIAGKFMYSFTITKPSLFDFNSWRNAVILLGMGWIFATRTLYLPRVLLV
jgi:hypothetical protein